MVQNHQERTITDEQRREFLKVLGVSSGVAAGGATLDDVRKAVDTVTSDQLAPVGEAIRSDLSGTLDYELLVGTQNELTETTATLTNVVAKGLPEDEPREEFAAVASAAQPAYEHLGEVGFFGSTTKQLPEFTPKYIEDSVRRFVASKPLVAPLTEMDFSQRELVDLLATVLSHRERIDDRHWVATDQLPREKIELGQHIPPMTKAAMGGVLLWLEDIDRHLWMNKVLITDEMLADGVWDARAMAAGFQLVTEGARHIAEGSGELSDEELAGLLSSGFALQAIAQNLLPQDLYWITEEMRDDRQTDIEIPGREV